MAAIDTNVLVRLLMQDNKAQLASAQRLVRQCLQAEQDLFVPVSVALELEWVLRSRFGMDKEAVLHTFSLLLLTVELRFDAAAAVEWALRQYRETTADFSDCLHVALASRAGEQPLRTFDRDAAKVGGAALLT